MDIISNTNKFELSESIVVFGNFDGLHKGHQLLINEAILKKNLHGYKTVFFTFEPHPISVLTGKDPVDIIFTPDEKKSVVESMGIDYYIEYPFTNAIAQMDPVDFVKKIIYQQLHAKVIIFGEDYKFGNKRLGDVALLKTLGLKYGYDVCAFPKLSKDNRFYSSTWLREVIKLGDMEAFYELSGRPFRVSGIVEHGRALGRTIGFPTANIFTPKYKLLPPRGVYASCTTVRGEKYRSITNVGWKPGTTIDEMVVETYLLAFDKMIYGEAILVEITHFIREEINLKSMDHLKGLIQKDMITLHAYFDEHPLC